MRDLKGIIESNIAARANRNGVRLLNELKHVIDALPEDSPRRISAQALWAEIVGDEFVREPNTGPHEYIPA